MYTVRSEETGNGIKKWMKRLKKCWALNDENIKK